MDKIDARAPIAGPNTSLPAEPGHEGIAVANGMLSLVSRGFIAHHQREFLKQVWKT
jgi:hypothetical protein